MVGGVDAVIVIIAVLSRSQAYLAASTAVVGSLLGSLILFLSRAKAAKNIIATTPPAREETCCAPGFTNTAC